MIQASSDLYNYFNQPIRTGTQTLEILINKGSKTYVVREDSLVQGSVSIERKSVSGSSFDIGEVYVDFLTFTINKDISQYTQLINAKCTVNLTVQTDTLYESIKLGTFIIKQSGIKKSKNTIKITADSFMCRFDKSLKRKKLKGNLYYLVNEACSKCNVEFGMTQYDFEALNPNTLREYEIKEKSSIKTYRDILMYAAQLIGGFATVNNEDKLVFGIYKNSNDKCNVNNNVIVDYSTGDEIYQLNGIQMSLKDVDLEVSRSGASDSFWLSLDSNPLLSTISDLPTLNTIMSNIWDNLYNISMNNFNFKFNGNPLIECGDIISIPERSLETYASSYKWVFHGKEEIGCVSVDDRKKTQTQTQKKVDSLESDSGEGGEPVADELVEKITQENTRVVHKKFVTTATIESYPLKFYQPNYIGNNIYFNGTMMYGFKNQADLEGFLERNRGGVYDYGYPSQLEAFLCTYEPLANFSYKLNSKPTIKDSDTVVTVKTDFSNIKGQIGFEYLRWVQGEPFETEEKKIKINDKYYVPVELSTPNYAHYRTEFPSGSYVDHNYSLSLDTNLYNTPMLFDGFRQLLYDNSPTYIELKRKYNDSMVNSQSWGGSYSENHDVDTNLNFQIIPKIPTHSLVMSSGSGQDEGWEGSINLATGIDSFDTYSYALDVFLNPVTGCHLPFFVFDTFIQNVNFYSEHISTMYPTSGEPIINREINERGYEPIKYRLNQYYVDNYQSLINRYVLDIDNYDVETGKLTKTVPVVIEWDEVETYQATATDAGQKIQDTADKADTNATNLEEANKKISDLTVKVNKLETTVNTQKGAINTLRDEVTKLKKAVSELQSK